MKENKSFTRTLIVLLILTMLALIAVAGTYAKYTSEWSGTGTAVAARWKVMLKKGTNELAKENFTIDLASTMTGTDKNNDFIQPGSTGEIKITIDNTGSDVAATVTAELDTTTGVFSKSQFVFTPNSTPSVVAAGQTGEISVGTWEWVYDKNDAADVEDTSIGSAANGSTQETLCNITLTAVQANPNA